MSIVSNASLLINVSRINKLDLLRDLYNEIVIAWEDLALETENGGRRLYSST